MTRQIYESLCYHLDLKCPPETHKGLVITLWYCWEAVEPVGVGHGGRKQGCWGLPQKGTLGLPALFTFAFWPLQGEQLSSTASHYHVCSASPQTQNNRARQPQPRDTFLLFKLMILALHFIICSTCDPSSHQPLKLYSLGCL